MSSKTADPIIINHNGVSVAGQVLAGVTGWTARQDYETGVFEVQLTLVTSSFQVELDARPFLLGAPTLQTAMQPDPKQVEPIG